MWVSGQSRYHVVEGGMSLEAWCESCEAGRTFVECELLEQLQVYFVPVANGRLRRLACVECGHDMELPRPASTLPDPYRQLTIPEPRYANLEIREGVLIEYLRLGSTLRAGV